MSNREFEDQIAEILRKLERLRAVQRGDATFRRVWVKAHEVPSYSVARHQRNIIVTKKRRRRHLKIVRKAA